MGFDGVVKNINKYCYVDYDAFIKKYLFSLFLADFSRFVVNHICANEIDKEEKDLLDCINQFMGTEDYEVYSDWFEIIEGELSRIYCNSRDIDTFFDNVPSFVINLRAALLVYRDACSFIDLGRDYFERGLIDLQNGYEAITGFELFESDFMYFSDFFENASNWCVSSSLDDLFNKFILKHGVSEYFTDILLNKILFSVLGGRLKLSSPMRRMLLKSILSSNLVSDENLGEGAGEFLNLLMRLADTVNAPIRMKKLILSHFSKSNNDSIKMTCCNYMELWSVNYSSDSSLEVRDCYFLFQDFFLWWQKECDEELKKQIIDDASKISCDVLRTVVDCTKEYVRFDFPFLNGSGLFEMDISVYRKYINYFEHVSDTRFIVVFIRELVRLGEFRFIPSGMTFSNSDNIISPLKMNPIRRVLCKEE